MDRYVIGAQAECHRLVGVVCGDIGPIRPHAIGRRHDRDAHVPVGPWDRDGEAPLAVGDGVQRLLRLAVDGRD